MAGSWRDWVGLGRSKIGLDERELDRLAAVRAFPGAHLGGHFTEQRWVVVDVESSGLDIHADKLIAIGAVGVRGNAIDASDSFEVVLRQDAVSTDENILVHGIGGTEQRSGEAPAAALLDFLEFIGGDPLIAYHAFFDESMLKRACQTHLGFTFAREWLDLAHLSPALLPPGPLESRRGKGLDDWLADFGITVSERHRAVADAVATAQLWLALFPALQSTRLSCSSQVLSLAREYDWLRRRETRT